MSRAVPVRRSSKRRLSGGAQTLALFGTVGVMQVYKTFGMVSQQLRCATIEENMYILMLL